MRKVPLFVLCLFVGLSAAWTEETPTGADQAPPPARSIPGINAADLHPGACVGCHIDMPDIGLDARLSTAMKRWEEAVEPELLARARLATPLDVTLKGKHPPAGKSLTDIPTGCIECHAAMVKKAPDFSRLVHLCHLTGGDESHFMTLFQGECSHCHKLDLETGEWSMPSGPEM